MQQKSLLGACLGLGVLGLLATAASPALAGDWIPANATYGAASVGAATATCVDHNITAGASGKPIGADVRTTLKLVWTTNDPVGEPAPTADQHVSFL